MARARNWTFTLNNWTQDEYIKIEELKTSYLIIGKEVGAESNIAHLQGYLEFEEAKTMTSIKKFMPRAHLEIAKGNAEQNKMYCSKDKDFMERGIPKKQGKRNDIERTRDLILDGANMRTVTQVATSLQSIKVAEVFLTYNEKKREWKPTVKWFYGATGTGKTRTAHEESEDPYMCADTNKWWQGYDAHEHVIIDDFRKDFIKFHDLLKLLDRYEFRVEIKGGSRQLLAKQIIITSPSRPEEIYDGREDINQLLRRIDEIREFKNIKEKDLENII